MMLEGTARALYTEIGRSNSDWDAQAVYPVSNGGWVVIVADRFNGYRYSLDSTLLWTRHQAALAAEPAVQAATALLAGRAR